MTFYALTRRFRHWLRRDQFADDLTEELRFHVELRERQLRDGGLPAEEAVYAARRQFGNHAAIHDASEAAWGFGAWERLLQDLRLGGRTLAKTPGFTAVTVLILAVGLGINVAVFSVVNAVMLRSLPYPVPDRLISLWEQRTGVPPQHFSSSGSPTGGDAHGPLRTTVSMANLPDYREAHSFAGLAAYDFAPMNLTGLSTPERVPGEAVSVNIFSVLGIPTALGRDFLSGEDDLNAARVVIISHEFWQRRLGGDTAVLARKVLLDGQPYHIIGVMPRGFQCPGQLDTPDRLIEFYVPILLTREMLTRRGDHDFSVVGRLRAGVPIESARAELAGISARLSKAYPDSNQNLSAQVAPLRDDLVRGTRDSLSALLGASGLIVLITCLNVAGLLLVRAIGRRHETSVRFALGANRFRVMRQFLAESLLLAAAGCAAAILSGAVLLRLLLALAPANIPRIQETSMDWRVFAVAAAIAAVCGIGFGFAPAWQASQTKPAESLKTTTRHSGTAAQVRWRTVLTTAEVALSLMLLVGAGLLLKSFALLTGVNLGFEPERVLAMRVDLPELRYPDAAARFRFFEELTARVQGLPGVQAVGYANRMPMRGGWGSGFALPNDPNTILDSDFQAVNTGYFETLGIPLLRGRLFTAADRLGAPYVAVVNQAFARVFLNGADPTGRTILYRRNRQVTIVGVVSDIRRGGKAAQIVPEVYLAAAQSDLYPVQLGDFAVRTASDPRTLVNAVRSQVWALDRDQPVTNVRTLEEVVTASVAQKRFQMILLVLFAGVAAGLAVMGIFGVLSYAVAQRTPELGIRIALGAAPWSILALVLRQAGTLVLAGVAAGVAGAYALTRYLQTLLFGVTRGDWTTYAAAAAVLAIIGVAAALVPARRGARVNPITALRYE